MYNDEYIIYFTNCNEDFTPHNVNILIKTHGI